jgi:hypothetical protein
MRNLPVLLLAVLLTAVWTLPAQAQQKRQDRPGGYHGELDFPISWKRYYSYEEWTKIMHDLQKQYSQLADIQSIGKSRMGRDQYLLTITAKSTGAHDTKRAMWVDGAIHGNEVNGITCSLYVAWYLLTRYDYDPYCYEMLNSTTFYILPGLNVDANDSYVRFPNTENNPREPYRPEDNDGDGLYDEDQTEDVDGDGELSSMYIEDPNGPLKLSPDKRRFIQVTDPEEMVQRFRRIGSEGYDNDGDGRINEDDIGGPDPNRNFPYGWTLSAGWPYPMSEKETRNVHEFQRTHDNIFAAFHYHNTGRLIMFSVPWAVESAAQPAQQFRGGGGRGFQRMTPEERLAQMRQENQYAQFFDRQVAPEYQGDMAVQNKIVTMGARIMKNYRPTMAGPPGNGQAQVNSYMSHGAYGYLIELWGSHPDADMNADGRITEEERMMWLDVELTGEGWIMPHKVDHPDLGEIWIGGSMRKHLGRTPPARYIESEAMRNAQFVLYCASQFPKVEIDEVSVTPATGDLCWVDVTVKNDRVYPTSSDRDVDRGNAVMDKLTFTSSRGITLVEVPDGVVQVDPLDASTRARTADGATTELRLMSEDSQTFRYLVQMTGNSGWVEFTIASKMGGTATRRINVRVQ